VTGCLVMASSLGNVRVGEPSHNRPNSGQTGRPG